MRWVIWLTLLVALSAGAHAAEQPISEPERANTFSIVAFDPEKKEWGVATASCVIAVGSVVPYSRAGVGAIASQSAVNPVYGPRGLELLKEGKSPEEVVKAVTEEDANRDDRQLLVLDAQGNVATFTGKKCTDWAGSKTGKNYACAGNLLTGEAVIDDMAKAFEASKGRLAWRLVAALEAAEKAGGDKRGKQSAAVLVTRAGPLGFRSDRSIDLRVDDHEAPIQELARILAKQLPRPTKD